MSDIKKKFLIVSILVIVTMVVFAPIINHDFINLDDDVNVYKNPYFKPVTFDHTLNFWKKSYRKMYIPVTYTVWAVLTRISNIVTPDKQNDKPNPVFFHLFNLGLHTLNTLLIFLIIKFLLLHMVSPENSRHSIEFCAVLGALLFSLHPVQVEAVAWVTGMKDVLSGFFSLIALWQYLIHMKSRELSNYNHHNYLLALFFFTLACLSKPSALSILILVLLLDKWLGKRSLLQSAFSLLPWFAVALPLILIIKSNQPDIEINYIPSILARPFIAGDALAFYMYKVIFPLTLGIDYRRSPEFVLGQNWIFFTFPVPVVLAAVILKIKKLDIFLLPYVLFLIVLLPVLGFIPFQFQGHSTVADRYLYIAMLGPSIAFSLLSLKYRGVATGVFILILGLLGTRSFLQTDYWLESVSILEHTIEISPKSRPSSHSTYERLGNALEDMERYEEAIDQYRIAIKIKPGYEKAHFNLGRVFSTLKRYKEALVQFAEVIKSKPDSLQTYLWMGNILFKQGKDDEAFKQFSLAVKYQPEFAVGYLKMGHVMSKMGLFEKAIDHYKKAILYQSENRYIYYNLGRAFARLGRYEEAIIQYRKVITLIPEFAEAHYNLGNVMAKKDDLEEAIFHFKNALKIRPDYEQAHNNMGIVLLELGRIDEAISHYSEALRINPQYSRARLNLEKAITAKRGH